MQRNDNWNDGQRADDSRRERHGSDQGRQYRMHDQSGDPADRSSPRANTEDRYSYRGQSDADRYSRDDRPSRGNDPYRNDMGEASSGYQYDGGRDTRASSGQGYRRDNPQGSGYDRPHERQDAGSGWGSGGYRGERGGYQGQGYGRQDAGAYGQTDMNAQGGANYSETYGNRYGAQGQGSSLYQGRDAGYQPYGERASGEAGSRQGGYQANQGMRGRGPRNYTRSDSRIQEDLHERLTDDRDIDASDVEVNVDGGTVTLSGTVQERWMKHRAEDLADACGGVRDVQNRIQVESSGSRTRDSDALSTSGSSNAGSSNDGSSTSSSGKAGKNH